ncbi:MAG: metallopeptidase family protein [Saccharofermentanales bacterium]
MITIDEMEAMLDEIAKELPEDFYKNLNGGILLLPETRQHPMEKAHDLYILGEYHLDGLLGRYIAIYYGSFIQVYGYLPNDQIKEKLKKTLKHEFRHHLESQAGDKSLERQDASDIENHINRRRTSGNSEE